MLIGDVHTRNPPASPEINRWDNGKPAQPVQWTCPRNSHNPPSWPAGSDGYSAGMAAQGYPTVEGGAGFPLYPCDKLGSPLRQDEQKMVTQVISTVNDPYSDQVVIDKGSVNGVYEGQPVISDKGVVGQVVAVAKIFFCVSIHVATSSTEACARSTMTRPYQLLS